MTNRRVWRRKVNRNNQNGKIMTRNELLKLPAGLYLLTDNIVNYKYILSIRENQDYEFGKVVGELYDYDWYNGSPFIPHTTIFHTTTDEEVDWSYSKQPISRFEGLTKIGGMGESHDFYQSLKDLRLIGRYNKETVGEDFRKFKLHWWIGLDKTMKNWYKNRRKEITHGQNMICK